MKERIIFFIKIIINFNINNLNSIILNFYNQINFEKLLLVTLIFKSSINKIKII